MNKLMERLLAVGIVASMGWALPAHSQEVKVMTMQAMSGPYAFWGRSYESGIKLAFDEAAENNFLDGAKVELLQTDYAGDKGQAIRLANQAVGPEEAIIVLGPTTSVDTLAVAPIFNDNKTPLLSLATINAALDTGPWIFKVEQSPNDAFPPFVDYLLKSTDIRKIATVFSRGNDAAVTQKDMFGQMFLAGGGTIVANEGVMASDTNFLPLVTKLMSMELDGIFFFVPVEQTANILIQLRQAGLPETVRFLGSNASISPRLMEIAGPAAEGTLVAAEFVAAVDRPINKQFESAYQKTFNAAPDQYAAVGYTMGWVALTAIKNASPNPTREKVRDALMNIGNVPSPLAGGQWSHDERQPKYGAIVTVVKDGQFTAVQ